MRNMHNNRGAIIERALTVHENLKPGWGKMNGHLMIVHCADTFRAALKEKPVALIPGVLTKFPLNKLVSQVLPWGRNIASAPEFINGQGGSALSTFDEDRQALVLLVDRFVNMPADHALQMPLHPFFGRLSYKEWSRLLWRHLDHHLKQFGV